MWFSPRAVLWSNEHNPATKSYLKIFKVFFFYISQKEEKGEGWEGGRGGRGEEKKKKEEKRRKRSPDLEPFFSPLRLLQVG